MARLSKSSGPRGNRTSQTLNCKYCDEAVKNVDVNATAITCYKCVMKLCRGIQLKPKHEK
jgi:hypothetical protein